MTDVKPYYYVRYSWLCQDLDKIFAEVKEKFDVVWHRMPRPGYDVLTHSRDELTVKADTLFVRFGVYTAVLFQKKKEPFTSKDMELRKIALKFYPHNRPTPFPWHLSREPKFKAVDEIKS